MKRLGCEHVIQMSDYQNLLFSYIPPENLKTFSYGHVVPPSNLLVHTVSHGPSDVLFDFTYENRTSDKVVSSASLTGYLDRV